MKGYDLLS